MKKTIRNLAKIFILLCVFALVLSALSKVLENKSSLFNKQPLYELSAGPDVIFIGASRMHNGIYPTVLWQEQGIAAYNAASPGEQTGTTYYVLRHILKDIHPRLVVFDLALVSDDNEISWSHELGFIHESMDFMPLSREKIELAQKAADYNDLSPLAFLSNIYFYHERWMELEKRDFVPSYNRELGAELLTRVSPSRRPEDLPDEYNEKALEGAGFVYLDKMMKLCDEQGIKMMFVSLPYSRDNKKRQSREYTYIQEAIKRGGYGLQLISEIDEIGLDFSRDFADSSHVNMVGAYKLSAYMGRYLREEVGLSDHRGEEVYADYDAALEDYRRYKLELAANAEGLEEFIMYSYGEPDQKLEVYAGDVDTAMADEELMYFAAGEIKPAGEMDAAGEQMLKDKWDLKGKDIADDKLAAFIRDKGTDEILACGFFARETGYPAVK